MNESNGSMELYLREHTKKSLIIGYQKFMKIRILALFTLHNIKMNCALTVNKQRT